MKQKKVGYSFDFSHVLPYALAKVINLLGWRCVAFDYSKSFFSKSEAGIRPISFDFTGN